MEPIIDQLKDFCNCVPEMEGDALERNVTELINLISNLTCWTQEPCETFLNSERVEIIDIEAVNSCSCCGGIVVFEPYYHPVQPDTFKVYLIEQKGIEETQTPIDTADFAFSEVSGVLRVDVRKYAKKDYCGCPSTYKLMITYDAGYELIPKCLLQLFCDLLHVIYDKNKCDCSVCQACRGNDEEDEVVIDYSDGDEVSPKLAVYLNRLIAGGYEKQLGIISLCPGNVREIWGVVV